MTERFSASNAERLMTCPGSANLEDLIPGFSRPVMDHDAGAKGEGTKVHEIYDKLAELTVTDTDYFMAGLEYYNNVRRQRRFKVLSEHTFTVEWLQRKPKTTVDRVLYLADEVHIFDWKWGKIPVNPVGNEQLMFYAAAVAQDFGLSAKGVTVHIVQPRADNMDSWFVDTNRLKAFVDETIETERKILAKDPTFVPGDHCQFCVANPHYRGKKEEKGSPSCPTMTKLLYPRTEVDEDEIFNS